MSQPSSFRALALIPTFNHSAALPKIIEHLLSLELPIWIIDDGSHEPARKAIEQLVADYPQVTLFRFPINQGKGAALCHGFRMAHQAGYSHLLQVDADGQHDLHAIATLLHSAQQHPHALVSGNPVYDDSIPLGRRLGRWITHLWVFIETLSLRISDSMCGLRVYPLAAVTTLLAQVTPGQRMDFDTEIFVRLFWQGVPPLMVPVAVHYPPDNHSNFRMWRDNLAISRMHTRLMLTLLRRLPTILAHRPPPLSHNTEQSVPWPQLQERGALLGMRIALTLLKLFGRTGSLLLLSPIVSYFFLTGSRQRRASQDYLGKVATYSGKKHPPRLWQSLAHYFEFSRRMIDLFLAWGGKISPQSVQVDNPEALQRLTESSTGGILVVSHHGNVELASAFLPPQLQNRLTLLIHTKHAVRFNQLLAQLHPAARANSIQVSELSVSMAIALRQRIEKGEWLAIAGDRTPLFDSSQHVTWAPFLGVPAPFPQGPWLLASLMECPVYLLFCRREKSVWRLLIEPFAERIVLPRKLRQNSIDQHVYRYAARLAQECLLAPKQWGNFYDFWPTNKGVP
ncbi:glycosyltransferase family 2 protein [Candidatus Magnetaquicoccus inordinatus]|uniref:glycosyltransferase family 2 protein n=1 Tax=Candidatus Magnetaquicoccus inordinatus TaxID=2496818 RepID=UPI00102D279E|nr:glycosyltransferase family 2 protein [Candidatus Magnetaquicoccus inordinatus]